MPPMNHVAFGLRRRVRCVLVGYEDGIEKENPLSEKLSESLKRNTGFSIFLPIYSHKY